MQDQTFQYVIVVSIIKAGLQGLDAKIPLPVDFARKHFAGQAAKQEADVVQPEAEHARPFSTRTADRKSPASNAEQDAHVPPWTRHIVLIFM